MRTPLRPSAGLALVLFALGACEGSISSRPGADGGHDAAVVPDASHPVDGGAGLDAAADAQASPPDAAPEPVDSGPDGYRLEDPLRGGTLGNQLGGSFSDTGWTVTSPTDRIWYAIPPLVEGSIEFTISNVTHEILQPSDNEIVTMYEAGYGIEEPITYDPAYRGNHYKMMIRIYGVLDSDRIGLVKLMWGMCPSGAPGYGDCGCGSFFEEPFGGDPAWDGTPQRIRIEWAGTVARYLRNGAEVLSVDWGPSGLSFGPEQPHFSLGSPRAAAVGDTGMPVGALFSDLVIEGIEGAVATCP